MRMLKLTLSGINGIPLYVSNNIYDRVPDIRKRLLEVNKDYNDGVPLAESLASAQLDGINTTMHDVLSVNGNAEQLVRNIKKATDWACNNDVLCHTSMRQIWEIVSSSVCTQLDKQGVLYRNTELPIGGRHNIKHAPETPANIEKRLSDMFVYCTANEHDLLTGIEACWYYTYIQPMCEFNGSCSRVLMLALWEKAGLGSLLNLPVIQMLLDSEDKFNAYFQVSCEVKLFDYDDPYLDLTPFVDYMLDVIVQALDKYDVWQCGLSVNESFLLSEIRKKGNGTAITVTKCARLLHVDEEQAEKIIKRLVDLNYLTTTDDYSYTYKI